MLKILICGLVPPALGAGESRAGSEGLRLPVGFGGQPPTKTREPISEEEGR